MLSGQLVLFEQEIQGNYSFGDDLKVVSTKTFFETFGEEALELAYTSRAVIQMKNLIEYSILNIRALGLNAFVIFIKGIKLVIMRI